MAVSRTRPRVAVIGAGPAGLMAAEIVAAHADVTVFDRMRSPARKFLLAGRGGLNLTHSEPHDAFVARYGATQARLAPALDHFSPTALRAWCADLGIETFVGTSGRVFPRCFKTSPLLRAWLRRLGENGVVLAPSHHWRGWDGDGTLLFATGEATRQPVVADAVVLALGGASWPQLGSDGSWVSTLDAADVPITPLEPANCGFALRWSELFRERFAGEPLKAVRLAVDGIESRGDVVITRTGLEGGAIYPLTAVLRAAIARNGGADLTVALRPDATVDSLADRLARRDRKQSFSTALRKLVGIAPIAVALLRESSLARGEPADRLASLEPLELARRINAVALRLDAPMPIAGAISTAGGVQFAGCDADLMLLNRPGVFVAGEMLDWEAPTGGYLLQASMATGQVAGTGVVRWLGRAATGGRSQ